MNRIATKLSLAFILVVVLGVASVSVLVRMETTRGFESYLDARGGNYLARAVDSLLELYRQNGDWRGAQPLLSGLLRNPSDRLVLSDTTGRVIADSSNQLIGQSDVSLHAVNQLPIMAESGKLGTLYLLAFTPGSTASPGRGMGVGAGQGRGSPPAGATETGPRGAMGTEQVAASLESTYLGSVDRAIATTALLSALLAIAVGLVVSRRITRPLAELADATREVAAGKLDRRLKVASKDELGQMAASFNTMAEQLQSNEEARRHMVADIAHDLRTPLAVIQGTVDGMLDGVIDTDRDSLESIKEEVGILTKLVADLRTLSLAEAGRLKLEMSSVDLLELARRSVRKIEPMARERGVSCRLDGDGPGPLVEVDSDRMGQLLGNLLDNALRYTGEGGTITVSVRQLEQGWARLTVADTGTGISEKDLPHIFDRFFRADQSRSRKSGGSGLGLAIVKHLVEAQGGRVWAESRMGKGTSFLIDLPPAKVL